MSYLDHFDAELHRFVREQFRGAIRSGATSKQTVVLFTMQRAKNALASTFVDGEKAEEFKKLIDVTYASWIEAVRYAADLMSERPEGHQLDLEYS